MSTVPVRDRAYLKIYVASDNIINFILPMNANNVNLRVGKYLNPVEGKSWILTDRVIGR